ncbi:NAD-dependent epimerase/dehydratase family protein [Candidatus Woesearchaeota archaeon]|nr:NAD-dependent epimerase/dehydratase family protein [Candidatus Woesearchaeota archaeon]
MAKMKVLVTGGTGFLGSNVVELLRNRGFDVHSCSRREGIDIRNYSQFKEFVDKLKPELVVHCAAHVGGIAYNALHPVEVFEDNVSIGLSVVRACSESQVNNLVNIMPNCTYPGHLEEYEESKFWDGPIHDSVLTYGLPRKMFWGDCFAYCQKNPEFRPIHLVFPNMYGPNDHFEIVKSHALGAFITKIVDAKKQDKKIVEIWGTGKPVREWIYVKDAAEGILKAIENLDKFERNEIMNIGVTKGISVIELANIIKETVGWEGEFVLQPEKPDGAMKKILVVDKMKEKLNWEPQTKLREGIKKTLEWYGMNH